MREIAFAKASATEGGMGRMTFDKLSYPAFESGKTASLIFTCFLP